MMGLSLEYKEGYKKALDYIRKNIFNASPDDVLNENHLITFNIKNLVPWSKIWLIVFKTALVNLENKRNCEDKFKKIKDPKTFRESLLEIFVADALIEGGFELECHPDISKYGNKEYKKQKHPDFKVTFLKNGEEYFIELTKMNESIQDSRVSNYIDEISKELLKLRLIEGYTYYGKFNIEPSLQTIKEIINEIKQLANKANLSGFEKKDIDRSGVIIFSFAIAKEEKIDLLHKWAKQKKLDIQPSSYVKSHNFEVDEFSRINKAIQDKQNQLPNDNAGIIVLQSDLFLKSKFDEIKNIKKAMIQLQQDIHKFDNLLLCIITGGCIAKYTKNIAICDIDKVKFLYDNANDFHRFIMIIENPYFKNSNNYISKHKLADSLVKGKRLLI
jgi:hypothetical protein